MVYLVYGSPCSGKSTYINEHAGRYDLICDVDLIYSAISTNTQYDSDLYVHEVALELKEYLLDIIRDRKGGWDNAYVVTIANTKEKVEQMKNRINADECIFIDTPYEVCMERAMKERPAPMVWIIQEWFETNNLGE